MHEGGRRNPRVVVPWAREAAFDIREEFGSRAARLREQTAEEPVEGTDIKEPSEDGATGASSENADE